MLTVDNVNSGMTGGSLTANVEYVGYNGTGTFTHSAGANTVTGAYGNGQGNLYVGYNPGSVGTYNLSGSAVLGGAVGAVRRVHRLSGNGNLQSNGRHEHRPSGP